MYRKLGIEAVFELIWSAKYMLERGIWGLLPVIALFTHLRTVLFFFFGGFCDMSAVNRKL